MGYAIICDARRGRSMGVNILALVDRQKSKRRWWTSDNTNVMMNYRNKSAAEYAVKRLWRNRARIVDFAYAEMIINEQNREITHNEAEAACEMGWDSHKSA